jgi:hypothetical protein
MNSVGSAFVFTSPTGLGQNAFYWEDFGGGVVDAINLDICFEKSGGVASVKYFGTLPKSSLTLGASTSARPPILQSDNLASSPDEPIPQHSSNLLKLIECDFATLVPGDYVTSSLREACFIEITAVSLDDSHGDYAPGGAAQVFDSSNPTKGNSQLGSPNQDCPNAGPGKGRGGSPLHQANQAYQNCEARGNLLIVPERKEDAHPIPAAKGGCINFYFTVPIFLHGAGVLGIPPGTTVMYTVSPLAFGILYIFVVAQAPSFVDFWISHIVASQVSNTAGIAFVFTSPTGLGENAFYWQDFDGGIVDAMNLEICFEKSGGVTSIVTSTLAG